MRIVRKVACRVLVLTGLARLAARLNRRKTLVLVYHDVYAGPPQPVLNFDGMHVRMRRFARQMRYLSRRYRVVPLAELLDDRGPSRSGKPLAAITFDDGYRNTYRYAYPLLRALNLPATVFPIPAFVLDRRTPWWDRLRAMVAETRGTTVRLPGDDGTAPPLRIRTRAERRAALWTLAARLQSLLPSGREAALATLAVSLRVEDRTQQPWEPLSRAEMVEMASDGISIGSHGMSHESFLHLDADALARELTESKRILETVTGGGVSWLAYPYGDFSPGAAEAAARAGYRGAVTSIEGLNDGSENPYVLKRIGVNDDVTMAQFVVAISGLRDVLKGLLRGRRAAARSESSPAEICAVSAGE